jgi:hypothetical protein
MYIAEIFPAKIRGRLVILFQLNVCLGILVAYSCNSLIAFCNLDVLRTQWRLMLAVGAIPHLYRINLSAGHQ